jgi:hypothetical protein
MADGVDTMLESSWTVRDPLLTLLLAPFDELALFQGKPSPLLLAALSCCLLVVPGVIAFIP